MMNWKVGDRAIYDYPRSRAHGCVVRITSGLIACTYRGEPPLMGHKFDPGFPPLDQFSGWSNAPEHFKLIPYDGLEISSWNELEKIIDWNPTRITV